MPPKSSTRSRKKVAAVVESKNGSNGVVDEHNEDTALVKEKVTKMTAKDANKADGSKSVNSANGKVETGAKEPDEEIAVPKRGRKKDEVKLSTDKSVDGSAVSDKNGEAQNGEKGQVEPVTLRRGRKKAEDKTAENVPETTVSGGSGKDETVVAKRGRKKAEPESAVVEEKNLEEDAQDSEDKEDNVPAKRGRRNVAKAVEVEEKASQKEDNAPVKRGRRNETKAEDSLPESQKDGSEKDVSKKSRLRKNIEAAPTEPESKEVPDSGRGRKRKVAGKEEADKEEASSTDVKSMSRGRKKKSIEEKPEVLIDEKRQLVVSLTRDEHLDNLAESEIKLVEEDSKTKSAKGPKSVAKGKRATEDTEESKPPKKAKEVPSKAKKDKIPDVTALDFSNDSKTKDGKEWNLKISSWNVNGIRAWLEKDGMTYLHHEKPDMMCIQETKCSDDKLPTELSNVEGYHCYWLAGDKEGYSGVGLLSKEKPMSVQYGIGIEEHDGEGRVITAEYDSFYLVTTYVPNSGRGLVRLDYRKKWDEVFRNYLKELDAKKQVVLCGDLNVSHEEIDLANPKSNKKNAGFTKEERDGFTTLLAEGFVDSFRHLYPDQKDAYTFWTYMMNARAKNVGWRLDYFVLSKKFCDQLCDSVIRKDVCGSDHCPISLFLHV